MNARPLVSQLIFAALAFALLAIAGQRLQRADAQDRPAASGPAPAGLVVRRATLDSQRVIASIRPAFNLRCGRFR